VLSAEETSSVTSTASSKAIKLWPAEQNMLRYLNAERKQYGLKPLQLDLGLLQSARQHAWWMAQNQNLQHTSRAVAENIAMGQTTSWQAIRDWMNSSGHRANILSRRYTRVGVAGYLAPDGTAYWCLQFLW
jgi:uncharacterized protein YkwD